MKRSKLMGLGLGLILFLGGCNQNLDVEPTLTEIKNIFEMATLETYFHNVAKDEKGVDKGISHLFEVDRVMWIEYTGIVKIGVNLAKVNLELNGDTVKITIPKAEVLSIDIDNDSLTKDSYVYSKDSFINKNEFTAKEQTEAIDAAQQNMKKSVENNEQLLNNAQERAKELIETYINQINDLSGKHYKIVWEYLDEQ